MAKRDVKRCAFCRGEEGEGRPMLSLSAELNICFPCIERLNDLMFRSEPKGDLAAEHVLQLISETHPELVAQTGKDIDSTLPVQECAQDELPTPEELHKKLNAYVIGQEHAKRTLCVAVYNH